MGTRGTWRWRTPLNDEAPVIAGYVDLSPIGEGGNSRVWRARQRSVDRIVAVKVLAADLDDVAQADFEREQRITASLDGHPNIVRVFDAGRTADGRPYLAMAHFAQGSYADRLRDHGPLLLAPALGDVAVVADALAVAHDRGVIHRDLKPANLLVSEHVGPVIADFGIAALLDGAGGPVGDASAFSVLHTAPEVLAGEPATTSADLYSLASTLYELLTGRAPFHDPDRPGLVDLLRRIERDAPPPIDRPDVAPAVDEAIRSLLAKDPDERPPDAPALAVQLRALLAGGAAPRRPAHDAVAPPAAGTPRLRAVGADPGATTPPPEVPGPRRREQSGDDRGVPAEAAPGWAEDVAATLGDVAPDRLDRTIRRRPPSSAVFARDPEEVQRRRWRRIAAIAAAAVAAVVVIVVVVAQAGDDGGVEPLPVASLDDPQAPCPADGVGTGEPGPAERPGPPESVDVEVGDDAVTVRFADADDGAASHAVFLACGDGEVVAVVALAPGTTQATFPDPRASSDETLCVGVGVVEPDGGTTLGEAGDGGFVCRR